MDLSRIYDFIARVYADRSRLNEASNWQTRDTTLSDDNSASSSDAGTSNEYAQTLAALATESLVQGTLAQEARWRSLAQHTIDEQASLLEELGELADVQRQRIDQLERQNGDLRRRLATIVPDDDASKDGVEGVPELKARPDATATFEGVVDWVRDRVMYFLWEMRDRYGRRGDRRMERAVVRVAGEIIRMGIP